MARSKSRREYEETRRGQQFSPDHARLRLSFTPTRSWGARGSWRRSCATCTPANVPGLNGENTEYPECDKMLVARHGFHKEAVSLKAGKCNSCGQFIEDGWG